MPSLAAAAAAAILFLLTLPSRHADAVLINRTIDDEYGDPITGIMPVYNPLDAWAQGAKCPGCGAQPSPNLAFNGTWHDSTYFASVGGPAHSIAISFNGSAIYVFFITVPIININNPNTHLNISLDGQPPSTYDYMPDSSSPYLYNQTVYSNSNLDAGQHTLVVSSGGVLSSTMLFDYAVYSVDVDLSQITAARTSTSSQTSTIKAPTTSTPSPSPSAASTSQKSTSLGTIVGITLGALAVLLLFALLLVRRRRDRNRGQNSSYRSDDSDYIPLSNGGGSGGYHRPHPSITSNKNISVPIWSTLPETEEQDQKLAMHGYMSPPGPLSPSRAGDSPPFERRRQDMEMEMRLGDAEGLKRAVTQVHYPGQ